MARLILMLCMFLSTAACTHNSIKKVQDTLEEQVLADKFYAEGDCSQAIPIYHSLAKTLPNETKSLLRIGNCHAKAKAYKAAEQTYLQVLKRDNKHYKAWHNLSYTRAQQLAQTVIEMYQHIDMNGVEAEKVRALTRDILVPFNLNIDNITQVEE